MKPGTALRLLRTSLDRNGFGGTLRRVSRLVTQAPAARRKARADKAFDEERGVDTASWVRVPELDTTSANVAHAVRYEPSSVEEFGLLMDKLELDHRDFTFVDYGSGKGRALMLAAGFPFKRIVGVEFAESLNEIARRNVATLGADAARVDIVLLDATEFDPPPGPVVLYFFDPFDVPLLHGVLDRVLASLAQDPRPAYIVLTGPPELAAAVEQRGFERVNVDELGWLTRGVFIAPATLTPPALAQPVGESTCA